MPVQVTVTNSCTVSATPMRWTVPVPITADLDSTALITVQCPPNIPYTIAIDDGLYPQGNVNRRVKHSTLNDFLRYDIYQNPPRSKVWGKGNNQLLSGNSGLLGLGIHPVYGRLAAKNSMRAGGYLDSLVIEVTF